MATDSEYELYVTPQHQALDLPIGSTLRFDSDGPSAVLGQVIALWPKRGPRPLLGRLSRNPHMRGQTLLITIDKADGGHAAFYEWAVLRVDAML